MGVTKAFLKDPANMLDSSLRRRMECADGFSVSVQYSNFHYCNAKSFGSRLHGDLAQLPEPLTVELGFPSRREPELLGEYAEEPKRLTKTVYGHVPLAVVDALIAKHGGLKI